MLHNQSQRMARARQLSGRLAADGIEGVVLSFVDTAGITRVKTVPVARLEKAAGWGVGMSPTFDTFLSNDLGVATDQLGGPDGDLRLIPDLDQLTILAASPGWAWAPVNRHTQDGAEYESCQRLFAARMVEQARSTGISLRMAFEIEWALGRGDVDGFAPAGLGPAYGMNRLMQVSDYGRDLLLALRQEGVDVEQLHPEYADGQYEVSIAPTEPVAAADRSVLVRQTVRAVSVRHGHRVSFAPSVVAGGVGNGGHVHLSAYRDGSNLYAGGPSRYGMSAEGEAFTAGILQLLPALAAIGAPVPVSYLRLVPSHWAGAFACWGRETREAALRLVTGTVGSQPTAANLEVKCFDLAANPYLVVGALIAAGLHGVEKRLSLPAEITGDPGTWPADELDSRGVRPLPRSLDEATEALCESSVLRTALGDTLFDGVVAVRRGDAARFRGTPPEQVVDALRWIY